MEHVFFSFIVTFYLFNRYWIGHGRSTVSESRKVPCDDLCGESESFTE